MRILLVIVLAIVAIGAAGVWALGEYGHVFSGDQYAAREPLVIEPEIVAANDQPAAPTPNSAPALRSEPAPAAPAAAEPKPAAPPAEETAATPEPRAAPAPGAAETASAPPPPAVAGSNPRLVESLDDAGAAARAAAPPPPPPPPPPVASATEPSVTAQSAPAPTPAPDQAAPAASPQVSTASAAAPVGAPAAGLESQFKSRKVTYNRPPEKLALSKAIDVSLVINATEDPDAGRDALQGFPGEVVERDVDLSNIVSAQLTGIGFDIVTQTVERQKLSGRTANRWQWRVTPTEVGTRTLKLDIFGYESGSLDAEPLAAYSDTIVVEVQQGVDQIIDWARGAQPVFAVLAALAAAASALVGFLRFREDRKKNRPAA